jgi:hypothetical protein
MPTTLETHATEESTYVVTAVFTDEDGDAVTPNPGLKWTLTDDRGTVVNSRQDVAVASASTIYVVLSGDDLQILSDTDIGVRIVTVEGTYDSSYGTNLSIKDSCKFTVDNLLAV